MALFPMLGPAAFAEPTGSDVIPGNAAPSWLLDPQRFLAALDGLWVDVPVRCDVGLGLADPPVDRSCGIQPGRRVLSLPILEARPCLDPACFGRQAFTARYAAAYDESGLGNTHVQFEWAISNTATGEVRFQWSSGPMHIPATPEPPAPPDWSVPCPGPIFASVVTVATIPDGWELSRTVDSGRWCV